MAKNNISTYISIIVSMIFWAFSFVWVKEAYESFGPITTIFLRLIISATLLFLFLKLTKKLKRIDKEDYKLFLLLSFFEPFLYFMCESFGLKLISSTLASIIVSTVPIFSSVFAFLIFKERLTRINILGIFISFLGVGLLIFGDGLNFKASPLGVVLMFLAVLSTIGYSLSLKKLAHKYPPVNIIAYQNAIGIFMFLPVFLVLEAHTLKNIKINTNSIFALIQLAIFASSLAFIFFTKAIKTLGVAKSNMFVNLVPVFTAIFAWWILKEQIDLAKARAITIVIAGLFISQIKRKKYEA